MGIQYTRPLPWLISDESSNYASSQESLHSSQETTSNKCKQRTAELKKPYKKSQQFSARVTPCSKFHISSWIRDRTTFFVHHSVSSKLEKKCRSVRKKVLGIVIFNEKCLKLKNACSKPIIIETFFAISSQQFGVGDRIVIRVIFLSWKSVTKITRLSPKTEKPFANHVSIKKGLDLN